jgi:hypothetical protein
MKNQTAVEQLRDRLLKDFGFTYSDNIHEEFKELEKENMINFANDFLFHDDTDLTAEQYYNETYYK